VINIRNEDYLKAFGENLKSIRTKKGLSREVLSAKADVEVMQIYRIENGKVNTTISSVLALAKGLGVTPAKLMDFKFPS
jgi:transcriptional regulator with XRE-family HTH domain